jgi:hypothetical protein
MAPTNSKRYFVLRVDGEETSVYTGRTPRQAALKAARALTPSPSEEDADQVEIRLRERQTEKVHVYLAWAWKAEAPDDAPDFLPQRITKANVAKQGIEYLND